VRDPGSYTLLSHEVGHALDSANGYTKAILELLADDTYLDYWKAWMREMVADLVGILLSGDAYVLAFCDYVRWMTVGDGISPGEIYPGVTLRIKILWTALEELKSPGIERTGFKERVFDSRDLEGQGPKFHELAKVFAKDVLPKMLEVVDPGGKCRMDWVHCQETSWSLAEKINIGRLDQIQIHASSEIRLIHSGMELAKLTGTIGDIVEIWRRFTELHKSTSEAGAPRWIAAPGNWQFTAEILPALRPTLLAADGTKVPPLPLLIHHQHIAFVAATNGQLATKLEEALERRREACQKRNPEAPANPAWGQLEFFVGADDLLKMVERHDGAKLIEERDAKEAELIKFLRSGNIALRWAVYRFGGIPIFASYWDWNEPNGRIHVSTQVPGTDIRRCPSMDYIWNDDAPIKAYQSYREYLKKLRKTAVLVASSDAWSAQYE